MTATTPPKRRLNALQGGTAGARLPGSSPRRPPLFLRRCGGFFSGFAARCPRRKAQPGCCTGIRQPNARAAGRPGSLIAPIDSSPTLWYTVIQVFKRSFSLFTPISAGAGRWRAKGRRAAKLPTAIGLAAPVPLRDPIRRRKAPDSAGIPRGPQARTSPGIAGKATA